MSSSSLPSSTELSQQKESESWTPSNNDMIPVGTDQQTPSEFSQQLLMKQDIDNKQQPPKSPQERQQTQTQLKEEEYQLAHAMALAIKNNPNLTADEIHELMKTTHMTTSSSVLSKSTKNHASSNNNKASTIFKSFRDAKKGFQDILKVGGGPVSPTPTLSQVATGKLGIPSSIPPEAATLESNQAARQIPQRELSELTLETTRMNVQTDGITPTASGEEHERLRSDSAAELFEYEDYLVESASAAEEYDDGEDGDEFNNEEWNDRSQNENDGTSNIDTNEKGMSTIKSISIAPLKKKKESNIVMASLKKSKKIGKAIKSSMRIPSPSIRSKSQSPSQQSPCQQNDSNTDDAMTFDDRSNIAVAGLPFRRRKSNSVDSCGQNMNNLAAPDISAPQQQDQPNEMPYSTDNVNNLTKAHCSDSINTTMTTPNANVDTSMADSNDNEIVSTAGMATTVHQKPEMTSATGDGTIPSQAHPKPTPLRKNVPRMSGVCWKRRGGLGKYKVDAWERRHVELHGTKLVYYLINENNGTSGGSPAIGQAYSMDGSEITSVSMQKKSTWFEQTFNFSNSNFDLLGNDSTSITSPSHTTGLMHHSVYGKARGHFDFLKEKATVHASTGHSGAPSPFALSIVVKGETKWKFCYDTHFEQMEWLIAITDIVVRMSVDAYNSQLLETSDPSTLIHQINSANNNEVTAAITSTFGLGQPRFQPPSSNDNTSSNDDNYNQESTITGHGAQDGNSNGRHQNLLSQQRRLWMMESYDLYCPKSPAFYPERLKSNNCETNNANSKSLKDKEGGKISEKNLAVSSDDEDDFVDNDEVIDGEEAAVADLTQLQEHQAAIRESVIELSTKVWCIPGRYCWNVTLLWNLSLFLSRSSYINISIFWYIFVSSNVILILCWRQEPYWQSVLEHHLQSSLAPKIKQTTIPTKSTRKNKKSKAQGARLLADESVDNGASSSLYDAALTTTAKIPDLMANNKKFIPVAGSSAIRIVNETDPPINTKNQMFAGFRELPGETLQVRSYGYSATKQKIPSPGTLYDLAGVDVFESPSRYPDMSPRVQLPEVSYLDDPAEKTWRCPDHFIVSVSLPTDPPKMTSSSSDGGGYTMTMYFTMRQDTRDILKRVTADGYDPNVDEENVTDKTKSKVNAVRLLEEWIRRSPSDPSFQARFKIVPQAQNLKEIGMPSWISSYNGKPFLIKRTNETGFLYIHPEISCVEFDVSLHPFPYLARKGICFMKDKFFKRVVVTFGFVIEGKTDDELPECLIGLVQFCYPDPQYAIQAKDFFNGTAPRSYE